MEKEVNLSAKNYFGKSIPRHFRNGTKGIVRNLSSPDREKKDFFTINFRLEVCDSSGNIKEFVPIILRYQKKIGDLSEGDEIIVPGERKRHNYLKPSSVYNLTTKSVVNIRKESIFRSVLAKITFDILSLVFFIGIFAGIFMAVKGDSGGGVTAIICIIGSAVFGMLSRKAMDNR